MKTLKVLLALLFLGTGIAKAQFTNAELQVSGFTCAICSNQRRKALRALPFISDIKTDLQRSVFMVSFKSGATVNFEQISKKVQESGFYVNSLKTTFNFEGVQLDENYFSYGGDHYRILNAAGKPLSGAVALTLLDKPFASKAVSRKYLAQIVDAPVRSGRLYHVTL